MKNIIRLKRTSPSTTALVSTATEYDPLGRPVNSSDFLSRVSLAAYEPFCVGNIGLSARGVQTSSSFDTLCRLVQVETPEERHLYAYDELNRTIGARVGERYAHEPSPDRVGGHYAKSFYKHDTLYEFDSLDRVTQITYANGDTVAYQYDEEGNVTQITDVHGKVTQYTYYNDGRLHTVVYESQTFTYSYDVAGRLESIVYPSGGLVASFTTTTGATGWDESGQLLCLRYLKSGSHFHRFEYTYDDSGNRISLIDTPDSGGATTWTYGYDYLNRLTSVTRGSSTTLYVYDESDNRISLTLPSGDEWTYGFDLADQISSRSFTPSGGSTALVESYVHDDDGNMISRTQSGVTTTYDWNTFNRLRQVAVGSTVSETTSYDHQGIRRLKVDGSGSSKSFSSGAMSLCDSRPSGAVSFVQGHQILGLEQGGDLYFLISDGLTSVRKVVDSSGASQGEFKFDEFGVPESSTTPSADLSAHSWVGALGQRNEDGGIYYARQRWYDSSTGRWLSQDPIGFSGGLNLFEYARSNPIRFVDPSGKNPLLWYLLGLTAEYTTPFIYGCGITLATSPYLVPTMEALISPPGYNPISPLGAAEAEAEQLAQRIVEEVEPHFSDIWKKGAEVFRGVDEGEMMDLERNLVLRHPDGAMKDFFTKLQPAEEFSSKIGRYEKIWLIRGKCGYQVLRGSKMIIYKTTGNMKLMIPNSQLPFIETSVVRTFSP